MISAVDKKKSHPNGKCSQVTKLYRISLVDYMKGY